jgi:glycosyltransferase involved in cell wall biosynthesis
MKPAGPSVVVDARMISASGIGTYIRNTLPRIVAARPEWRFTLLGEPARLASAGFAARPNVVTYESRAPVYSVREQLAFTARPLRNADLFWAPHYNAPLFATRRLVVTVHDVMHLTLPEYARRPAHRGYASMMYSAVRRRATAVICDSQFTRRELARLVGEHPSMHVVPLGVDPSWFSVAAPDDALRPDRPFVVFVGLGKPHKNLVGLLRAFALVRDRVPHDLLIVGTNRDGLRTRDRCIEAAAAPLRERLRFVDHLDLASLQRCVAAADALVQPSFSEGFGLPPLEAMAAGTPCLVSRIPPLCEVCGDAASYCDPHDPRDIGARLVELLTDDRLSRELSARGRERARSFSWDKTAAQTLDILERALSS